jgi:hypothetical protein
VVAFQLTVAAFQDENSAVEALKTLQYARLIGSSDQPGVVLSTSRPFQGSVCQTTLPDEALHALKVPLVKFE